MMTYDQVKQQNIERWRLYKKTYGRRRFTYEEVLGMDDVVRFNVYRDGWKLPAAVGTGLHGFRIGATMPIPESA